MSKYSQGKCLLEMLFSTFLCYYVFLNKGKTYKQGLFYHLLTPPKTPVIKPANEIHYTAQRSRKINLAFTWSSVHFT